MSSDLYRWAIQSGMPENLNGDQQALWMYQRELRRDAAIERLRADIDRLRQFTDRFPTTQDGHPVAGGDTVYCKLGGVIEPVTIPCPPRHGVYSQCYHTYEAAVAAEAAGGKE